MKHYLYRILDEDFKQMDDYSEIKIDYSPVELKDGDLFIIFVSGSLVILGEYMKKGNSLIINTKPSKKIDLRGFIGKLSFVKETGPRAYKVFAKKVRDITEEDYKTIMHSF